MEKELERWSHNYIDVEGILSQFKVCSLVLLSTPHKPPHHVDGLKVHFPVVWGDESRGHVKKCSLVAIVR